MPAVLSPSTTAPKAHRRRVALVLVALLALASLAACTPEETRGMQLTNDTRHNTGRAYLNYNDSLYFKAQGWSQQLASSGGLSHSNLASGAPGGWRRLGENVGVGGSVDAVFNALMGSEGHRNNILDPGFNNFAVGVTRGGDGRYWVVQEFATL